MKSDQIKHSLAVGPKSIQSRVYDRETGELISFVKMPLEETGLVSREALAEQPAPKDEQPAQDQGQSCYCPNCEALSKELAALKAQQQEPVVWMYVNRSTHETVLHKHMRSFVNHSQWKEVPLYGEPLANHELQCVCGAVWCGDEMVRLPDKRPPASKPWVGLTDEQIEDLYFDGFSISKLKEFARAIEAKLREKNA